MLLTQVWLPWLQTSPPTRLAAKIQVVALTELLCKTPSLLKDISKVEVWCEVLRCVVMIVISPDSHLSTLTLTPEGNIDDVEIGYGATFSVLHFALHPAKDPFSDISDASTTLIESLSQLCSAQPGRLTPLIQQGLQSDPKMSSGLESLCKKLGVSFM